MPALESKSDVLFERMRSDILSLKLLPGAPLRLPGLSTRYQAGLTPLRECLNRLCGDHLVVPVHNKGFRVAPLTRDDLLDLERSRKNEEPVVPPVLDTFAVCLMKLSSSLNCEISEAHYDYTAC